MLLSSKQLIGLSVATPDGQSLGVLKDVRIDSQTGIVMEYIVTSSKLVKQILATDLVISKDQVIEITKDRIIAESGTSALAAVTDAVPTI